ncbi:hypothetical protein ACIRNY_09390 [Capnocytophaga canimorsus]|uniref:hypothetical protein n=1 Tax=Capnocytophaga canimorsus TaxID=28188 RepID=UPI00384AB5C7
MKVYKLANYVNSKYAILRPSNKQNVRDVDTLDVWWDDWCSGGNKIGDFVFCYGVKICRKSVFNLLSDTFQSLKMVKLDYKKTEKELKAKDIKKLKWLPQETVDLVAFFSPKFIDCLPQSSVIRDNEGIDEIIGVEELRGNIIIPREQGKGLFFDNKQIQNHDFFTLGGTNLLLCTEKVKEFCENQNYENVVFLEMGEII